MFMKRRQRISRVTNTLVRASCQTTGAVNIFQFTWPVLGSDPAVRFHMAAPRPFVSICRGQLVLTCIEATTPYGTYIIGLLAMIKCSVCSCQCDNFDPFNLKINCHRIFPWAQLAKVSNTMRSTCKSAIAHGWSWQPRYGNNSLHCQMYDI